MLSCFATGLFGGEATLEWNPSPPSENVTHYKLWTQSPTGEWALSKQVATNTTTVEQATGEWVTYAVTAVNSGGLESAWSVPLTFQLGPDGTPIFKTPSPPTGLRIKVIVEIEPTGP